MKGKGGINNKGTAFAWGERTWMKCMRREASEPGIVMLTRNWGTEALNLASWSLHEYCSSLQDVSILCDVTLCLSLTYQKSINGSA